MRGVQFHAGAGQALHVRRPVSTIVAQRSSYHTVVHASGLPGGSSSSRLQIAQEDGWNAREQMLFSELVATRQQVDKLLAHQQVLLSLLAAQYAAEPSASSSRTSSQASSPSPIQSSNADTAGSAIQQQMAINSSGASSSSSVTQGLSPVNQLLSSLGAVPAAASLEMAGPASSSITEAIQQSVQGDVLKQDTQQQPAEPARQQPAGSQASDLPELPELRKGDCSAWWMEKLHVALLARGYYSGDADVQSWTFGSGTARALERFQQESGLPISSVSDAATWASLLSELPEMKADMVTAIAAGKAPTWNKPQPPTHPLTPPPQPRQAPAPPARPPTPPQKPPSQPARAAFKPPPSSTNPPPYAIQAPEESKLSFNPSFAPFEGEEPMPLDPLDAYYASAGQEDGRPDSNVAPKKASSGRPPEMSSGDAGGFFIETLHAALLRAGCDPTFREMDRAEFGKFTLRAVKRFQNASNLPVTGRVDDVTWALLLKDEPDLRSAFVSMVAFGTPVPPGSDGDGSSTNGSTNGVVHHTTNGYVAPGLEPGGDLVISSDRLEEQQGETRVADEHASTVLDSAIPAEPGAPSETQQQGVPPVLHMDDDDILWVSRLHRLLSVQGFYPPEDECVDWVFGSGTQEAVMTAQASAGLPETGVVCLATWKWLMRDAECEVRQEVETELGSSVDDWQVAQVSSSDEVGQAGSTTQEAVPGMWPVIMESDGNEHVGLMQRALESCGYHCGEDEPRWWQCGADTINALRTFQACVGLPETGVCDAATWRSLAATTCPGATSYDQLRDMLAAASGDEGEGDLSAAKSRVWLLGEQRWEEVRKNDGSA